MIYSHELPAWQKIWNRETLHRRLNKHNGGYYYSKEILENIIPLVDTDRNWITICCEPYGMNHCIVFVHDNLHPEFYDWLRQYKDLILVCNWPEICEQVKHLGKVIYLPVSIDVGYVKQFLTPKTEDVAYVGRSLKLQEIDDYELPDGIDWLCDMPREELLSKMAQYKKIYAIDRVAQEAKVLGCKVLPYIKRFPDPDRYQVLDNRDAARILQEELDKMEKKQEGLHDIIYILKNDVDPDELRYSLRSVCKNFPYRKIWFYGGCPEGIYPDEYVEDIQSGENLWERSWNTLRKACNNSEITEDFWLFNDDFFIMHKVSGDMQPITNGSIYRQIRMIEKKYGQISSYTRRLRAAARRLSDDNLDRINYEVHVPILLNKYKVLHVMERYPDIYAAFRSMYGNYYCIGGTIQPDNKISDLDMSPTDDMPFLSTTDESFREGVIGAYIREKFKKKCKYEKEVTR